MLLGFGVDLQYFGEHELELLLAEVVVVDFGLQEGVENVAVDVELQLQLLPPATLAIDVGQVYEILHSSPLLLKQLGVSSPFDSCQIRHSLSLPCLP